MENRASGDTLKEFKDEDKLNNLLNSDSFQLEIKKRAEEKYKERIHKNESGDLVSDWLQSEKEVRDKYKL
jgi:hypothetical protein